MARDLAKNTSVAGASANTGADPTLAGELLSGRTYKVTQGQLVRRLTMLAILIIVAMGAWSLHQTLIEYNRLGSMQVYLWPGLLMAAGAWVGYRLVNWAPFADFLIAVQAELKKVTWPSQDELKRASVVVIVTIFILATSLFAFDALWQFIFSQIGVTA